jgi:nucleotide-binding universal stress UspA family protein
VLTCRPGADVAEFPRAVVVGVDGSDVAHEAAEVGRELAARLGARLEVLVAQGGKPVDIEGLWRLPTLAWDGRRPVDALVAASRRADLVVVGAHGLHGPGALGSVSDAVVAHAACSVLVVRPVAAASEPLEAMPALTAAR